MAYENLQKGQKREVIVESPVSDIKGGSEWVEIRIKLFTYDNTLKQFLYREL